MTKLSVDSGPFGQPLSSDAQKLVNDVRLQINQPINPFFDKDFNIYRFVLNAERAYKSHKEIVEHAAKALNNHLKLRKCLRLDELPDIPFADNEIFKKKYLPWGEIQRKTDSSNRLLQYVEYKTITVEYIAHSLKSSDACRFQFWQFEHILLRHIVDMNEYEINPFTMLFVSSGTLQYYSHLFHYENYPELVYPVEMVNIAKWIYVPYKIIKAVMPAGFADRFRLYDGNYLPNLMNEINSEDIPETLGGKNKEIKCTSAVEPTDTWHCNVPQIVGNLETLVIHSRKLKYYKVEVTEAPTTLSWYFHTDSDVYFGVFFERNDSNNAKKKKDKEDLDTDSLDMVYPMFKLTAKLVHEFDSIECTENGTYYVVFGNKHSWIHKRTVEIMLQKKTESGEVRRIYHDGTNEKVDNELLDIQKQMELQPFKTNI
ncbi:unnamed protein product [Bursaphelenchus okinawaensis]|uniref:CRAL-TRIO domain-containing protein n=1 Tax=Bursaphelenchus okinawaensis TaxID=465554 RepID=A0A811LIV5_9BILA|nr:unnamed protein product [Bursaphelenchus okinawaensis]CAG9126882.1 unnamed protein product [Bursaphelenchus okinawaensis]